MAALGPTAPINDWIFQKEGATIDTPSNLEAAQHLETVDQERLLPRRMSTPSSTRTRTPGSPMARACSCSTVTGRTPATTRAPGKVGFFLMPPATEGGAHGAMSAPLTYGIAAKGQACGLRGVLPELGRHQPDGPRDRRAVGGSNPGGPTDLACPRSRRALSPTRRWPPAPAAARTMARWTSSPTPRVHLCPGLDARAAEDGRRATDRRRPAQGRPGRVRVRARSVTFPSRRDHG